ncbi:MAG: AI-2E family transporter [Prevotella sp.]|jgi:predicted PurR-regulated permease PerM|nr:AI-2E family transporter [Prevotella sp.]
MEQKKITFDSFVRGFLAVLVVVAIIMLLNRLSAVLLPFFLAWLIAFLLFPLVKFFQYKCHMKYRILSILSTFLVMGIVITILMFLIVPPLIDEAIRVKELAVMFISSNENLRNVPDLIEDFIREHLTKEDIKALITQEGFIDTVKQSLPKIWNILAQSLNIFSSMFSMTMVVLYTLFILVDYEEISKGWVSLLPRRYRPFARRLVADVGHGMNLYFRGQAMVAACVGVLFSIGFLIINFPLAVGLGLFIGLLNMVPYLQLVGFIPTILLAVVKAADTGDSFWMIMLSALIVFAVVQIIQDTILTPKIMGHVTGLNPAIILLSLSIWGSLLGILGMVIALPMTTLLITYYQRYVIKNQEIKDKQ